MTDIGLVLPDELSHFSLGQSLRFAKRADEVGLHSVWKQESSGSDSIATLAAIAQCTTDIYLGTGVANVYSRSPTLLGMSAATLQHLSDGRCLLGLGVSSAPLVEQWHGMSFDRPLRRLREAIEIVRQTTTGDTVAYDGEIFEVGPYSTMLETSDSVPILNAAIGEANRRLTAEYADGWLPAFVPQSSFASHVSAVRGRAGDVGRDPDDLLVAPYVPTAVDADPTEAERRVRYLLAQEMAMGYNEQLNEYGFGGAPDRAHDLFRDGDREAATAAISDEMVDEFTVSGTASDVRGQLLTYFENGADIVVAMPSMDATETHVENLLDVLGALARGE